MRNAAGTPPLNLKFLFEGEEETGSPNLAPFVHDRREKLAADLTVSADGGMWDEETFDRGVRAYVRFFDELAKVPAAPLAAS